MRIKPLHYSLSLLALLGTVHGSIQASVPECAVKAFVRAPDLAPNTVVQGDARVKISAGCPTAKTVTLGLRLKERSFVKALRSEEDRERSKKHAVRAFNPIPRALSPWDWPLSQHANDSDEIAIREILANKELWIVREEMRVVFETMQDIVLANGVAQDHDVVQDFAVLVPSANFPPALDFSGPIFNMNQIEVVDVEFMYEYFVHVPFTNGTTAEVSAGVTSFQPLYDLAGPHARPSYKDVEASLKRVRFSEDDSLITNYTAQITGIPDSVFTEGSKFQATVVITRTGPARTFTAPLRIQGCVVPESLSKWAVEYGLEGSGHRVTRRPERILRSTSQDIEDANPNFVSPGPTSSCHFRRSDALSVMMPNSTADEVRSQDVVTTTSEAITIPIAVDRRHIPSFETHYQTLANALRIMIETPRVNGEDVDPDDPSTRSPFNNRNLPVFEDDVEEWVPWEKKEKSNMPTIWNTYSGTIPVIVRPTEEVTSCKDCPHAGVVSEMNDQIVMSEETGCAQPRVTRYLDEDARGPIFVDPGVLSEVLAEGPVERERRAPVLRSVVSLPPKGDELVYRYYTPFNRPIYVGETWVKKVAHKKNV